MSINKARRTPGIIQITDNILNTINAPFLSTQDPNIGPKIIN